MNELKLVASALVVGACVAGCSTPTATYKTVDENGKEQTVQVTDASGKAVPMPENSKETIEKLLPQLKAMIEKMLRDAVAQGATDVKRAVPDDAAIQKLAGRALTEDEMKVLRAAAGNFMRDGEKTIIVKAQVDEIIGKMMPAAKELLRQKQYAKVRELIWRASTTDNEDVNEGVRKVGIEFLNVRVNPENWVVIEKDLTSTTEGYLGKEAFDEAEKFLKAYPRIRTYSTKIDERLKAVQDEVVRLGVDAKGVEPIRKQTGELVAAAAKILDVQDDVTNTVKSVTLTKSAAVNPDLEAYEKKLAEYKETLIRYNCTKENAEKIVESFKKSIAPFLAELKKDAVLETQTDKKEFTILGTMAVNKRTDALVAGLLEKVAAAKAAAEKAKFDAALAAAIKALREKVAALVAQGKFDEAREVIWQAAATGNLAMDVPIFAEGEKLLREEVNPKHWIAIESEIKAVVKEKVAANEYDACLKYLDEYKRIRQHSIVLDQQLARVREEAEVLGANPEAAVKKAQEACAMVEEAKKLVDHLDQIKVASEKPTEEDTKAYEKELQAYREKLARYHAEPDYVEAVVSRLDAALRSLMRKPGTAAAGQLLLGTNAINDRLGKLLAAQRALVEGQKIAWQKAQFEAQYNDLIKRVRAAVAKGEFTKAREIIRDEKLVGNPVSDAALYALRIGLLNSVVNPRQLAVLLEEIDQKTKAFIEAEDFKGLAEYIKNYPYVHDDYAQIRQSLNGVEKAMIGLDLAESPATDYVASANAKVVDILEERTGSWMPNFDFGALEAALTNVAMAVEAQYYEPDEIKGFCLQVKAEVKELLAERFAPITTKELNAALGRALEPAVLVAATGIANQEYLALLDQIDKEVSMDAQIAMAEEAISRQLGIVCEKASFKVNAILGEYSRAFRLLKKKATLSKAEATSLVLGAAYLDQPAVIPFALKLGADINGVSARDTRKRTALMLAIDAQNLSLLKLLVEAGASATATDAAGNSVLHYAVKSGSVSAVRAIAKAASMVVANAAGETPLFEAVKRNQEAMVQTVIDLVEEKKRGDFVNMADKSGLTAFALAAKMGARDVLDALAAAGALYSEKDLILAEEGDHIAVAQWLVAQGADVNAPGVMAKACPAKATGRYLIHAGGVGDHTCEACKPADKRAEADAVKSAAAGNPEKKVEAEGTITFKVSEEKLK